ncbi:hypothetical protein SLS53_001699 [Cytospora paraplurivora]|uniref:Carbonic anhydrase n=1 Tax=Cytospora paraplurivora TaxID=2898453 RepID=A0AAN9UFP9_9PEZI
MSEQRGILKESGDLSFVLTCLDPRCVPENYFGPDFHGGVFRNAGGRVTEDVIRSFTVLRVLAGLKNVAVVHHTEIIETIASVGPEAKTQAEKMDFKLFTFEGLSDSVKEDVRALRSAETLAGINVYGFELDTHTGRVERVDV